MANVKPTMVQLGPELVELLDARAQREGVSRSELIRRAIEASMVDERSRNLAQRYREAYRSAPADGDDEWGSLEGWHRGIQEARASEAPTESEWP